MTEDQLNPHICPSALEEDGMLDRDLYGSGAHVWHQGSCSECGTTFDTENLVPCIIYYWENKEGMVNAGVAMLAEATVEAARRYMDAHQWTYDEDADTIEVYALNSVEDEAGNQYKLIAA